MSQTMQLGFQLMAYGLTGVFLCLFLFIGIIRALTALFPVRPYNDKNE